MRAFADRRDAGRALGRLLRDHALEDPLVLGLPRGGVPVAAEVAEALAAPLDVFLVRKLGLPAQPELAMGAIATGGVRVLNEEVLVAARVSADELAAVTRREEAELREREQLYRGDRPALALAGRTVVLVDDGVATGATMRAAVAAARQQRATRVLAAAPVAARATRAAFERDGAELVCVATPSPFRAVGYWYRDFGPVSDEDVRRLLARAAG
jgi:putative phosphoribosyl transferase